MERVWLRNFDSAVNQAEQFRDQQVQQQYSDRLGVYVREKAEQIDRLQSSLAAALTSEQAQLQAIQQRAPGWTAGKKAHAQWEQQVARRNHSKTARRFLVRVQDCLSSSVYSGGRSP